MLAMCEMTVAISSLHSFNTDIGMISREVLPGASRIKRTTSDGLTRVKSGINDVGGVGGGHGDNVWSVSDADKLEQHAPCQRRSCLTLLPAVCQQICLMTQDDSCWGVTIRSPCATAAVDGLACPPVPAGCSCI